MKINKIALVLDESGSMATLTKSVEKAVREFGANLITTLDQSPDVSVYRFGRGCEKDYRYQGNPRVLDNFVGQNQGSQTPLRDAVKKVVEDFEQANIAAGYNPNYQAELAKAIKNHKRRPVKTGDDVSFLILTITDGQENSSRTTRAAMQNLIAAMQQDGRWTFTFQGPRGTSKALATMFGVEEANCIEWDQTEQGTQQAFQHMAQAYNQTYTTDRSAGLTKSASFYKHTTDLSQIKQVDLRQLDNMTSRFAIHTVPSEQRIDEFVQKVTGYPYLPGTVFFQFTKPEEIQAQKQVALMEKGGRTIFGGLKARNLIGLQDWKDGKVNPGNHANLDLFVQSTSSNRKLVRGTKVLVVK